jgi:hypothetical protein
MMQKYLKKAILPRATNSLVKWIPWEVPKNLPIETSKRIEI